MELCKNCSAPIPDAQVYCCFKCWQEHREIENELSPSGGIKSQIIAWGSIIGMFFSLFILLVAISSFIDNFQYYLIASTIGLSFFVFLIIRYMHDSEQLEKLLELPKTLEIWKLIGFALAIDIFVVKPLHVVFTLQFFPDAQEQEVITALEEMSQVSAIITAFSVSILTPILEELLFRGFILGMFLKCYNNNVAIFFSALLFAIVHEPVAIGMAFGGGLIYGWLRVRTGSIIPSMIAHMIWNSFISIIVLFY